MIRFDTNREIGPAGDISLSSRLILQSQIAVTPQSDVRHLHYILLVLLVHCSSRFSVDGCMVRDGSCPILMQQARWMQNATRDANFTMMHPSQSSHVTISPSGIWPRRNINMGFIFFVWACCCAGGSVFGVTTPPWHRRCNIGWSAVPKNGRRPAYLCLGTALPRK